LLCNRQAALEIMLNHPDLKHNAQVQDAGQNLLKKQKIRNVESFQIELVFEEDDDDDINLDEMNNESSEISYLDNKVCNI
jgi:hypothetical protein